MSERIDDLDRSVLEVGYFSAGALDDEVEHGPLAVSCSCTDGGIESFDLSENVLGAGELGQADFVAVGAGDWELDILRQGREQDMPE